MTRSSTNTEPVNLQGSPSSRSIISKFANTFSSKQRNPVDHEIRLDEPFRPYFSGDSVSGAVLVNAAKPFRITHLVVRLHGFVKVVNNARQPGDSIPYDENLLTSMRNKKGIEYFGNGFARLFEEECILCGDGRLFGQYEFRFDLNLPGDGLPSSIDFEHGTIAYLLSSTITRPTTISPTLTCHKKIKFTGNLDVARLQVPKSRTVSLEAVGRRAKSRLRVMRRNTGLKNGLESNTSSVDENSVNNRTSMSSPQGSDAPPRSPVPSIASSASGESSTFSASNTIARPIAASDTNGSTDNVITSGSCERTITAKTELLQSGCLPGDVLQLRIHVDHVKPIQTMQGVIVTLFRQGRIDTHPAIPLGPMNTGDRRQYEDYYPRSRTGLGGLSLSSAGSSRVFRQDLAQTMTPLFVDPHTLTAPIKTSIQMPDHVFPTISSVPGDMITFKYYVEAVIDLRGKPPGQDRFLPHLNIVDGPQHAYGDPKISKHQGVDGVSYSATPGFNYLITDQIRRTKGIVYTTLEIIVGTRDTTRARGKQKEISDVSEHDHFSEPYQPEDDRWRQWDPPAVFEPGVSAEYSYGLGVEQQPSPAQHVQIPPPEVDENMDEKSQIRRAEQRLLPSSAPQDEDSGHGASPSAPFAYDEDDFISRYGFGAPAPAYESPSNTSEGAGVSTHDYVDRKSPIRDSRTTTISNGITKDQSHSDSREQPALEAQTEASDGPPESSPSNSQSVPNQVGESFAPEPAERSHPAIQGQEGAIVERHMNDRGIDRRQGEPGSLQDDDAKDDTPDEASIRQADSPVVSAQTGVEKDHEVVTAAEKSTGTLTPNG